MKIINKGVLDLQTAAVEIEKLRAEVVDWKTRYGCLKIQEEAALKERDGALLQVDVLRKALEFVHKEDQNEVNWFTYEGRRLRYVSMAERGMIQNALKYVTKRKVK